MIQIDLHCLHSFCWAVVSSRLIALFWLMYIDVHWCTLSSFIQLDSSKANQASRTWSHVLHIALCWFIYCTLIHIHWYSICDTWIDMHCIYSFSWIWLHAATPTGNAIVPYRLPCFVWYPFQFTAVYVVKQAYIRVLFVHLICEQACLWVWFTYAILCNSESDSLYCALVSLIHLCYIVH